MASKLSDTELRNALIDLGFNAGPVTGTTRKLYEKKYETLTKGNNGTKVNNVTVKKTPVRNTTESSSPIITPLSAKKKGKKAQVTDTESSDNELDLTLPTNNSVASPRSARGNAYIKAQNEAPSTIYSAESEHSPPRNVVKRTLTPPRSSTSVNKRTPLRLSGNESVRGNIFSTEEFSSNKKNHFQQTYSANSSISHSTFDEDDHMETSRILSPSSRFDPFRVSYSAKPQTLKVNESPIEKIRRFSRGAWGYFSRPMNSTTPCADKILNDKYGPQSSRFRHSGKYTPNAKFEKTRKNSSSETCDVSGWILAVGGSFLFVLVVAYLLTAHPKTVRNGKNILQNAIRETLNFFYTYAFLPIVTAAIAITVVFGGYRLHKYREIKKVEHKERLMHLVERITDVIRDSSGEGIAELHVRDIIMPPTKRQPSDWKLWKEAADFINLEDSRVRTEVRLVDGDECNVWVWVPVTKQKWQGTAISQSSLSSSLPNKALTRCIKLRGISFSDRQSEKNELRNELLCKLSPIVPVHMDFVTGAENIVYLMLKDLEDAKNAFYALHSHWFNGSLISAKYLRDERYVERFPNLQGI